MSTASTPSGALSRRLVLEAPVETADGAGGVTLSYAAAATVWAKVTPLSAHAGVVAAHPGADIGYRIVIRAGPDVTIRHRFRDGVRILRVVSVRQSADRQFLEIDADERKD
jgi:SPP1 family predicted phage head-tail adaptor